MLLLPEVFIRFPYHGSVIQDPKSTIISEQDRQVLRETREWLRRKLSTSKVPVEALSLRRNYEMLHRLFRLERKRGKEFEVSFALIEDTGYYLLLRTQARIRYDFQDCEQNDLLFEGDQDILFFLEHGITARNGTRNDEETGKCGVLSCTACCEAAISAEAQAKFRLESVFEVISASQQSTEIPSAPSPPKTAGSGLSLLRDLPEEIIEQILNFLDVKDLLSLSRTCKWYNYHVTRYGVKLHLYKHQERAVKRMLDRETKPGVYCLPTCRSIEAKNSGAACYVDLTDGSIHAGSIPCRRDFLGGLFCDEPGLGKTITALSLIMRTRGMMPKAPPGALLSSSADGMKWSYQMPSPSSPTGRMVPFGTPPNSSRRRSLSRSVRRPDFLNPQVGVGSVPSDERKSTSHVLMSRATLVLLPSKLMNHWRCQIYKHIRMRLIRVGIFDEIKFTNSEEPPAVQLAYNYDIILATLGRVRHEYENMRSGKPLLAQVHFLRVVIDEGHVLGGSLGFTNLSMVCEAIRAERKWIMTGTPTPNTPCSDVRRLRPLIHWLDGSEFDRRAWIKGVERPYELFKPCALQRLQQLLERVVIRSSKKLIPSIPKCEVKTTLIDFSPKTSRSYNNLVTLAQRNMLLADWYSEDHHHSMLNRKNAALCRDLLFNLRLACCCAGMIHISVPPEELRCTLDTLVKYSKNGEWPMAQDSMTGHPLSENDSVFRLPKALEKNFISALANYRVLRFRAGGGHREYRGRLYEIGNAMRHGCLCERCGEFTQLPIVTPCAHLLCNACILVSRFRCTAPGCEVPYVMESAEKQVPKELIELQPAYENLQWVLVEWEKSDSAKLEHLVRRILKVPARAEYNTSKQQWEARQAKVIVFSQFKQHLQLARMKLDEVEKLKDGILEAHGALKNCAKVGMQAVEQFRTNEKKWVLLMDYHFAEGHDLSMVEHIFLLDPIWDQSMENQVISRAHRMGAARTIYVEKLVIRNSIEHEMTLLREELRAQPGVGKIKRRLESAKRAALLKALHVVRPSKANSATSREILRDFEQRGAQSPLQVVANGRESQTHQAEEMSGLSENSNELLSKRAWTDRFRTMEELRVDERKGGGITERVPLNYLGHNPRTRRRLGGRQVRFIQPSADKDRFMGGDGSSGSNEYGAGNHASAQEGVERHQLMFKEPNYERETRTESERENNDKTEFTNNRLAKNEASNFEPLLQGERRKALEVRMRKEEPIVIRRENEYGAEVEEDVVIEMSSHTKEEESEDAMKKNQCKATVMSTAVCECKEGNEKGSHEHDDTKEGVACKIKFAEETWI